MKTLNVYLFSSYEAALFGEAMWPEEVCCYSSLDINGDPAIFFRDYCDVVESHDGPVVFHTVTLAYEADGLILDKIPEGSIVSRQNSRYIKCRGRFYGYCSRDYAYVCRETIAAVRPEWQNEKA